MEIPGDLRSIIYVPDTPDVERWERLAIQHCETHHYQVVGLVLGRPDDDHWHDVCGLLATDAADVVVVGRRDHLPSQRRPRVEVVGEDAEPRNTSGARYRRPRALN
jgi:hypothetical protein